VWNNFSEPCTFQGQPDWFDSTKSCIKKSKPEDFERSFQDTIQSIRQNGFDSVVPISTAHYPLNGAHWVAAAIALDVETLPVKMTTSDEWFRWDEAFFVNAGFDQEYANIVWSRFRNHVGMNTAFILRYISSHGDNVHAVVLFPSVCNKHITTVQSLLAQHSEAITERAFTLGTKYAQDMFVQQLYPDESWVSQGAWGKTMRCFPVGTEAYPIRVYFISTKRSLSDMMRLKQEIRQLYGIGKGSIHMSDTKSQAIDIAKLVLNENSLAHINQTKWSSPLQRKHFAGEGRHEYRPMLEDEDEEDAAAAAATAVKNQFYLDGKPCALERAAVERVTRPRDWSPYRQYKFLQDLAKGKRTLSSPPTFRFVSSDVNSGAKGPDAIAGIAMIMERGWDGVMTMSSTPYNMSSMSSPLIGLDPDAAFQLLSDFLGVLAETKRVAHALALRYSGSLQRCIAEMCGQWHKDSSTASSSCVYNMADALDRYSPLFACMHHGHDPDAFHPPGAAPKMCSGAKRTVIRHLQRLGSWGWAGSLYNQHKERGSFAKLITNLSSPHVLGRLVKEMGALMRDNLKSEAIHVLRVKVSQLLYVEFAKRAQTGRVDLPASFFTTTSTLLHWLAQFEYTYTGQLLASAMYCLSVDLSISVEKALERHPGFFSEALKWCEALAVNGEANSDRRTNGNNHFLEGAQAKCAFSKPQHLCAP
jgi:hypothetical protein